MAHADPGARHLGPWVSTRLGGRPSPLRFLPRPGTNHRPPPPGAGPALTPLPVPNGRRGSGQPRPPWGAPAADWSARALCPPARGAGAGVNEVDEIPPPPRLPPLPRGARPPPAPSPALACPPADRCTGTWRPAPLAKDPASRTRDGQAQLAVHPHRGGEEPARQGHVSKAGDGNPNFPGGVLPLMPA